MPVFPLECSYMESKIREYNDEKLILFVRENNEDAKDYLYEKYSALIHKEISNYARKSRQLGIEFADLTQEAMLGFSHAINNFNPDEETKFITFATLCIRRSLTNYVAKFKTGKNKSYKESLALDAPVDDSHRYIDAMPSGKNNDPLKKIIDSETLKEVIKSIEENLSENERTVLALDLEDKSVNEIAEITHMSNKQIYNLIHRARNKLKP